LFDWVDEKLVSEECNRSLKHTKSFLETQELSIDEIVPWLQDYGGFCDCEVIANVEDVWGDDST
jgi:hypothetical protein